MMRAPGRFQVVVEAPPTMTRGEEFLDLLRRVAARDETVDAVEAWFVSHRGELTHDSELSLKEAVQEALVRIWTWRSHHQSDGELRAAFAALAARLGRA
jgi:hypothetical protein